MADVELRVCKFNKFGHCKFGSNCRKQHITETCTNFPCRVEECPLRHPKLCRYFVQFGQCRFDENCSYLHFSQSDHTKAGLENEIEALKVEIEALKSRNTEIEAIMRRLKTIEIKLEQPKEVPTKVGEIDPEAFKCEDCGYSASTKSVLKRHQTMKHRQSDQVPFSFSKTSDEHNVNEKLYTNSDENEDCASMEVESEEIDQNQCHLCMKKFENLDNLWNHYEDKHVHFNSVMKDKVPQS